MYRPEQLLKYPYFTGLMGATGFEHITDALTGLIARPYITGFARALISEGIPFSFVILDLDNFKFINDTYGHCAGDEALISVSKALIDYTADSGVAGRFGGDEILLIDLKDREYSEKKAFFDGMYTGDRVLRREYELAECRPFITGTIGCATFPDDASDFNELFETTDKALYRGKIKGRNCYIIYVPEKHKDLDIRKFGGHGICKVMQTVVRQTELVPGTENKLYAVLPLLMEEYGITDLYYSGPDNVMHAVLDKSFSEDVSGIETLMKDDVYDIYHTNNIGEFEKTAPALYRTLKKHRMQAAVIIRAGMFDEAYCYLMFAEPGSHRIWQEDECGVFYFLAKLIASGIHLDGDVLPE